MELYGTEANHPIAYALMMGKAEEDYKSVFRLLKNTVEQVTMKPMRIKRVLVDFEKAIWNGVKSVFGNQVKIRGCWFHFNQAIYRHVKDCHLEKDYLKGKEMNQMIRYLMTMPLIDARNIPKVFDILLEEYKPTIDGSENVAKLFNYIKKQWMGTEYFTPADWSCFEKAIRTNNQVEIWNKRIFEKASKKSANIYVLTEVLARDAAEAVADQESYNKSNYQKRSQIEKDIKIIKAYHAYRQHKNSFLALKKLASITAKYCKWSAFRSAHDDAYIEESNADVHE